MLGESELICFSATKNPKSAKEYYERTLGLKLVEDSPYAIVFDAGGTMLRIQKVEEYRPANCTILGWKVSDIRMKMDQLAKRGVTFERYEGVPQDELGIWRIPGGAQIAWFKDPDGNTLSLTQWPS